MNTAAAVPSPELTALFSQIHTGSPLAVGDVTLVPLLLEKPGLDADLLEEGLAKGRTSISEVSEGGSVDSVRVTHSGVRMLLLVDGEQIIGAKQNRIVNASFLVPPGAAVDIPVSCVEKGRWRYDAPKFAAGGTTLTSSARGEKLKRVTLSIGSNRGYNADQQAVWKDVDGYLDRTRTISTTSAFADAYRSRAVDVESQLAQVAPTASQVGLAAVRGDVLVAIDVFGSPDLYARGWKKLARGMLAEVYESSAAASGDATGVVARALAAVAGASATRTAAPGCGETLHGTAQGAVFGAVAHGGRVYHAVVAPG